MTRIAVQNPCRDWRAGHIVVPWSEAEGEKVIVRDDSDDDSGKELRAQVDKPYGANSTARQLAVVLRKTVKPGDVDHPGDSAYLEVEPGTWQFSDSPQVAVTKGRGFHLYNGRIDLWFNISTDAGDPDRRWYAGAATSVVFEGKEILDAFRAEMIFIGQDPEKRCMQIDRLRLSMPGLPSADYWLFDQPWELIGEGEGPARAFATVRSPKLDYGGRSVHLLRTISLFYGADYVIEELSLEGEPPLSFSARYFTWFDAGIEPVVTHLPHIPDWLAIGVACAPWQGYGFSCDVHVPLLEIAPWSYPDRDAAHRVFAFELGVAKKAKCLHLFSRGFDGHRLADESGRRWHDQIYKPLAGVKR